MCSYVSQHRNNRGSTFVIFIFIVIVSDEHMQTSSSTLLAIAFSHPTLAKKTHFSLYFFACCIPTIAIYSWCIPRLVAYYCLDVAYTPESWTLPGQQRRWEGPGPCRHTCLAKVQQQDQKFPGIKGSLSGTTNPE